MLRPEPPGNVLTQSGDIDNRLKTLFDALAVPQLQAIPSGSSPTDDERPFYCLLEDDNLVTAISVQVDELLEPDADRNEVDLTIKVVTRATKVVAGNLDYI